MLFYVTHVRFLICIHNSKDTCKKEKEEKKTLKRMKKEEETLSFLFIFFKGMFYVEKKT